ncbi:rolling circle replication-associated protein [Ralstonia pseudosolanacearum]
MHTSSTRSLRADGERFHFVAVLEFHQSGGIHIHAGVHGFRDVDALREHWYAVVGVAEGNVDIQGPNSKGRKRISGAHKVAAYLSKYITKGTGHKLNEQRYWASKGIDIPERFTIGQYRSETDGKSFADALDDTMRWLVGNGANFQGMMAYVSHGRKAFWFAMAATGHVEPVELDHDDDDSVVFAYARDSL